ncbi:hypothetical protein CHCC20335_1619 [Bacillus paralicheniformis]|nr:hypothetical protein CHCC20335_1619 [Bacillus paralicheniformis]
MGSRMRQLNPAAFLTRKRVGEADGLFFLTTQYPNPSFFIQEYPDLREWLWIRRNGPDRTEDASHSD